VDTNFNEAFELLDGAVEADIEDAAYFRDLAEDQLSREQAAERAGVEAAVAEMMDAKRRELFPKPKLVKSDS
jgi:hypothetical protein